MKKKVLFTFFVLALIFSLPLPQASAQSALIIDADKQLEFAEHYYSNKNYSQAVSEYRRFIFFFPEDDRVELVMFKISMSYFNDNRFNDAINSFIKVINKFENTDYAIKSFFMISNCHTAIKQFDSAISNLHDLIELTDNLNIKDEAYYRIGWIYLDMASQFETMLDDNSDSFKKAQFYFANITQGNHTKYKIQKLNDALDDPFQTNKIPQKHPALAGTLSIIPGAGHLYCGRYRDALISFLLNAGLMMAAYESFEDGNEALGSVISLFEIGFYFGNIYGAVGSAHKYNSTKTQQYIKDMKETMKVTISYDYNKNTLVSFKYNF